MPIHHRIIPEIIRRGATALRVEDKVWKGLYGPSGRFPGVKNYKYAARGVKHGLASGAAVGSFITDPGKDLSNGVPPGTSTPSDKQYQKSYRQRGRYGRQYRKYNRPCRCHRRNRMGRRWKH